MRRPLLAAAVCLVLAVACGDDDESAEVAPASTGTGSTGASTPPRAGEPPADFDALAELFEAPLADEGLDLTRASVVRLETGPHVALYGAPTDTAGTAQDYLDRLVPSAAAAGAIAFDAFPSVASFDLCQEPVGATEDPPPAVTVVMLTRDQWESVPDWSAATLTDLLTAASRGEHGRIEVSEEIGALDDWHHAVAEFHDNN